ncbi:hypothetical protein [Bradyrhizobium ganzhouense]|uniref:hypothetical protein n=1 Tax=Bradyrhizobium ganzhouense TaxID=1179767 RepID=UPI003CF917F1
MRRLRELLRSLEPYWSRYAVELMRLPAATRLALFALISWSGLAAAATACALIAIESSARSAAATSAGGASGVTKLERGNGEAILQRPVFARTRQAMLPVLALPQTPSLPAGPPPALRDTGLRLTGVFINSPTTKAFLTSAQRPVGSWVQPDEMFGGWKLVAVRPNEIEVEADGERVVVPFSTARTANDGPSGGPNVQPHAPAGGERFIGPFSGGRTAHEQAGTVQNLQPYPPVRR